MDRERWMRLAIEQARAGIASGQSPFGAVVLRGEQVVGAGHNEVWKRGDPTAHAEIVAIQRAAATLKGIDLSGCVLCTTTEPCPMCAAAIHWARLDECVFGAAIADAATAGFNELRVPISGLYAEGGSRVRLVGGVLAPECAALFAEWKARSGRAY